MLKILIRLILSAILIKSLSACVSSGPLIKIETSKTADDFIVECEWWMQGIIHGGDKRYKHSKNILRSGESFWCGVGINLLPAGSNISHYILHPTYSKPINANRNEYKMLHWKEKNKEAKDLFKKGYWKDTKDPIGNYLRHIDHCGITKNYLSSYHEDKTPDYLELKKKYFKDILECNKERERIVHEYGRSPANFYFILGKKTRPCINLKACPGKVYRPDLAFKRQSKKMWGLETWKPYLNGTEEEINRLVGNKRPYLVVYNDPKGGGTWLLIDAYSQESIKKKYPDLVSFDDKPKWMSNFQKERFVMCNGVELRWDIEEEPTGWLLDYSKGIIKDIYCSSR